MSSRLIGYDLSRPGQEYSDLYEAIKSYETWWHQLDSTWIIESSQTTEQIRNHLKQYVDSNDKLLVVALTGEGAWTGFNQKGTQWLKDHL